MNSFFKIKGIVIENPMMYSYKFDCEYNPIEDLTDKKTNTTILNDPRYFTNIQSATCGSLICYTSGTSAAANWVKVEVNI